MPMSTRRRSTCRPADDLPFITRLQTDIITCHSPGRCDIPRRVNAGSNISSFFIAFDAFVFKGNFSKRGSMSKM